MTNVSSDPKREYRNLPSVDALLRKPSIMQLATEYGQEQVTNVLRRLLRDARQAVGEGKPAPEQSTWPHLLDSVLMQSGIPTLRSVINASGVIVHTNLGRAPLSSLARRAVAEIVSGYSNLEYDLSLGARGSRHDHARNLLCELTGAEDALIVNNNAGAVYLVLAGLCCGNEVLISRGQLVEIGGGFRIPDVLRQSGATLVEVGTTNRTHARDYSQALSLRTAAIMRVHSSNFRQVGFVIEPELGRLAEIAHDHRKEDGEGSILIDDLGSGTMLDTRAYGLAPEPMIQESLAAGADIVTFSGDKLLGGPQAGLILGRAELISSLRRHPMARAFRVDKMTLVALDATLRSYQRQRALEEIPVWQMIGADVDELGERVQRWQTILAAGNEQGEGIVSMSQRGESAVGGGSLPGETLPTCLLAIESDTPDAVAARLREGSTPVVCRIQKNHLLFDPRTVLPDQDNALLDAILRAWRSEH